MNIIMNEVCCIGTDSGVLYVTKIGLHVGVARNL